MPCPRATTIRAEELGAPGIGDRKAYLNREAAVESGFNELINGFTGVRDWKGTRPHTEPLMAQKMIDHLETLKGGGRQMTLSSR
jgi:hypothetical protein